MKIYHFAIIGGGMIAGVHAAAIAQMPNARIAAVYDPVPSCAQAFATKYGCNAVNSLEALLADEEIEIVNICTPSGTHAEIAIAAAKAGKHVVVEKPLAITSESADAVVEAQKKYGVRICVISQLRFSESVQALKTAIQAGAFGKPVLNSLSMRYFRNEEYYRGSSWRGKWATDGGGALMNQGIHGLDLLCYLCGPVRSVYAQYRTLLHKIEVEDTLCAVLEFENGSLGTLEASTAVAPGQLRQIKVGGTLGSAVLQENEITDWNAPAPRPDVKTAWKVNAANDPSAIDCDGHRLQFENLLDSIEFGVPLLVDSAEGCRVVKLILAIYESARTGKRITLK